MADPLEAAAAIEPRPLLVVHGTADRWVPVAQARELAARAGLAVPVRRGGGSRPRLLLAPGELRDLIAGWLAGIRDCEPAGRQA